MPRLTPLASGTLWCREEDGGNSRGKCFIRDKVILILCITYMCIETYSISMGSSTAAPLLFLSPQILNPDLMSPSLFSTSFWYYYWNHSIITTTLPKRPVFYSLRWRNGWVTWIPKLLRLFFCLIVSSFAICLVPLHLLFDSKCDLFIFVFDFIHSSFLFPFHSFKPPSRTGILSWFPWLEWPNRPHCLTE